VQAQQIIHHRNVVVPTIAVVPSVVLVPAYSAYYNPQIATDSAIAAEIRALRLEFQKLREALTVPLPPGTNAETIPNTPKEVVSKPFVYNEAVLVKGLESCAQCHQPKTSSKLGGNFTMFQDDGQTVDFKEKTSIVYAKIIDQVKNGLMPKKGKLTPEQKEQIINFYSPQEPEPKEEENK